VAPGLVDPAVPRSPLARADARPFPANGGPGPSTGPGRACPGRARDTRPRAPPRARPRARPRRSPRASSPQHPPPHTGAHGGALPLNDEREREWKQGPALPQSRRGKGTGRGRGQAARPAPGRDARLPGPLPRLGGGYGPAGGPWGAHREGPLAPDHRGCTPPDRGPLPAERPGNGALGALGRGGGAGGALGGRGGHGGGGGGGRERSGGRPGQEAKGPLEGESLESCFFFRVGFRLTITFPGITFLAPLVQGGGVPEGRIHEAKECKFPIFLLVATGYVVPPERS
jgi:hypothetical protein